MKATKREIPFQLITVSVTIESKREMELLKYVTQHISRSCIDKVHTPEQRDALLNLAEIVYLAARDDE